MKKLLLLPVIVLALSACSTLKVSYDVDGSVDFEQYKTFEYYGWAEESDKILNRLDRDRIEQSSHAGCHWADNVRIQLSRYLALPQPFRTRLIQ